MAKRLCCGFRGKIYYTDVNEKEGIMVGQRVEVTDSATEAVAKAMSDPEARLRAMFNAKLRGDM